MLKKIYLFLALSMLSAIASDKSIHQATVLKDKIAHISQEKKSVMLFIKRTIVLGKKAIEYKKLSLNDGFQPLAVQIGVVINNIISSLEFNNAVEYMTNYQTEQIVEYGIFFNDITYYEPYLTDLLNSKINTELAKIFPIFDPEAEQLFNIFYVTIANYRGGTILIEKLIDQENLLNHQLESLIASNLVSNDNLDTSISMQEIKD